MNGQSEDRTLSAFKQEWHERGHTSLEVTMSGFVTNPEYSWLGASPNSVVHDSGCTDPNGLLEIKCPYNYHDSNPFQAAFQKGYHQLEEGKQAVLIEQHHYYIIKCKDRWLSRRNIVSVGRG